MFTQHRHISKPWRGISLRHSWRGRLRYLHFGAVLAAAFFVISLGAVRPAAAQSEIRAVTNEAVVKFPDEIEFRLNASSGAEIQTIYLIYGIQSQTCQESSARHLVKTTPGTTIEASWAVEYKRSGLMPPGTHFWWQWEISDSAGRKLLTEVQHGTVQDQRHTWNSLSESGVTLQWYQGPRRMGQLLLDIAVQSLERLENEMGMRPPGDIWITVYPTFEEVREVIPYATEWAGGVAFPEYSSTIFGFDETSSEEWARSVIPHELAHLVVDQVIFNCRGISLPTWLNEGLAVYSENMDNSSGVSRVKSALDKGSLPRLRSLESGFSAFSDSANLSYAQSGMVAAYLYDTYGRAKMTAVLAAVQSGLRIDQAMLQELGIDTDGLDDEWRASLGFRPAAGQAATPTRSAQTATRVPTLALWTSAVQPTATATPTPTATAAAAPIPSPSIVPTHTASAVPSASPTLAAPPGNMPGMALFTGAGLGVLLLGTALTLIFLRRSRRR